MTTTPTSSVKGRPLEKAAVVAEAFPALGAAPQGRKLRPTPNSDQRSIVAIGDRVRARRTALGLSLRDLNHCLSTGYISRLERGERRPSLTALRSLALALECSVHWLETGKADPSEQLASLVLAHRGEPLPNRAIPLARAVLRKSR